MLIILHKKKLVIGKKITFESILAKMLYIFVLFPYIKIISVGSDTQPGACIISIVTIFAFVLGNKGKMPRPIMKLIGLIGMCAIVWLLSVPTTLSSFISFYGYISVALIAYASYLLVSYENGINLQRIKVITWIWIIIAVIQQFYNRYFMSFLISDMRTTDSRGVTSLAVEPTYFAQMIFFMVLCILCFEEEKKEKYKYFIVGILGIVILAKSSMVVLVLGVGFLIFIIITLTKKWKRKYMKYLLFIPMIGIVFLIIMSFMPETSRLINTLESMFEQGVMYFFKNDASANDRLSSIVFSFKGAIENFFIPHGFDKWQAYEIAEKSSSKFFWYGSSTKIMSMYGALVFEMGILGVGIIYIINSWSYKYLKISNKHIIFLIFLNLIFLTAVPLSTPFVGFWLGMMCFYCEKTKRKNRINEDFTD